MNPDQVHLLCALVCKYSGYMNDSDTTTTLQPYEIMLYRQCCETMRLHYFTIEKILQKCLDSPVPTVSDEPS